MSRKVKYSSDLKVEICRRYLRGESVSYLASEYGIKGKYAHNEIREWAQRYKAQGKNTFDETNRNRFYSKELKLKVIDEYNKTGASYESLANKYGITKGHIVSSWITKYNNGIENKDYNPNREVYTMKSRTTTYEERMEIVNHVLSNNMDYKGAAELYTVPYANVYAWVKKYKESGDLGVQDHRGRPSKKEPTRELSELEKMEIENEKLKKRIEYLEICNLVLKKNIEIRERMKKDSLLLGKKIDTKQSKK